MRQRLIILLTITGLYILLSWAPGQAALTDNLIGYWAFNGSGADVSGNNRNVVLQGAATYGTGLFGQALSLPGQDTAYAVRPSNDTVFDFGGNDFTVQIWANLNTLANEQTIIEKFTGSGAPGWTISKLSGATIQFWADGSIALNHSKTIDAGNWHHILIRRNNNVFDFFVDGINNQGTFSGAINASSNPLLIGKRNDGDVRDFPVNGRLDETAIWSRALTDSEVAFLWNSGAGNPVTPVPLPSTVVLLGGGLAAMAALRRRLF